MDQKKYLQKYLNPKVKKEKKHKKESKFKNVQIIDDDVDFSQLMTMDNSEIELYATGEDAPQIVGIIDERPLEVQLKERFKSNSNWTVVNEGDDIKVSEHKSAVDNRNLHNDVSPKRCKQRTDSDDDLTVRRRKSKVDDDLNVQRNRIKTESDSDVSPPRRDTNRRDRSRWDKKDSGNDSDLSPTRRSSNSKRWQSPRHRSDKNESYKIKREIDSDVSPCRRDSKRERNQSSHSSPRRSSNSKRDQNRNSSDRHCSNVQEYIRKNKGEPDPKQGKQIIKFNIRNPDAEEQRLKAEQRKIQEEKYATWGKGLKQVEEKKEKLLNDCHEASKPLARYADDEDLENYLKEQEREGDPMLEYIRKEEGKSNKSSSKSLQPRYEGAFMPNRFGIPPGHRWDGVDRSNGYETNWFNVRNSKKILEEEAYKWSTDDM